MDTSILQVDKKQDMILCGTNSNYDWIVVADGHGNNTVIDFLRNLDWESIIQLENPIDTVKKKLIDINTTDSGSTLSIVKSYPTHIDMHWVGDSTIKIYKKNRLLYASTDHNHKNRHKYPHLEGENLKCKNGWDINLIDKNTISMIPAPYYVLSNGDTVNMFSVLGHDNLLDYTERKRVNIEMNTDTKTDIDANNNSDYKIVVGSDGFWNMVLTDDDNFISNKTTTSDMLLELAKQRWNQEWDYVYNDNVTRTKIPSGDDICVGCIK